MTQTTPTSGLRSDKSSLKYTQEKAIENSLLAVSTLAVLSIALIFLLLIYQGLQGLTVFGGETDLSQYWSATIEKQELVRNPDGSIKTDADGDFVYEANPVTSYDWQPTSSDTKKFSLVPLMIGSAKVAIPAAILASMVGLLVAIYLSELAPPQVREVVKPALELLAGVPSVVLGFFALVTIAAFVQWFVHIPWVFEFLTQTPGLNRLMFPSCSFEAGPLQQTCLERALKLGTQGTYLNTLVGALGVALVVIPIVATIAEDALRAVPNSIRDASMALGASRWQTAFNAVLPAAVSGLAAAVILGLGRAIGETMVVLMATGNASILSGNVLESGRAITATIAAELGEAVAGGDHYNALFFIGAVLFVFTFALNIMGEIIINRARQKVREGV
ncbi:phosphate ABC transporter permease subunit PstC [Candidatus Cyanaurora vandensis]|uniref:phosphate ABC transporter permease subunit PstC n=1 Tax=Candidatus Cyanaurora vandensis TaxID=2714958 RepID=UPI0025804B3B|nr:phosphate ABC transporter permease subunit PstC [Candidatus Cyanaurora vandensis]